MTERQWSLLMKSARMVAQYRGERVFVFGVRIRGGWMYIINAPKETA